jgi:YHS domain-containing protein
MHPLYPVCDMDVEKATASSSNWRARRDYFCMPEHRRAFDTRPSQYLQASASGA